MIFEDNSQGLCLRPAICSDINRLFDWVSTPDNLQNKEKATDLIEWQVHKEWFNRKMSDTGSNIWIVEMDNAPVGQVRVQLGNGHLSIDIFIDHLHRKKGYGHQAIKLLKIQCHMLWPGVPLLAVVKKNNHPSLNLCYRSGFQFLRENGNISNLVYKASTSFTENR